jgi:hypothetical protein
MFAEKYAPVLQKTYCFGIIIVIFLGMLACSVLGLLNIPAGLNEQVSM